MTDSFDPRFQRPRLTDEECRAALAALEERTGILQADLADWMIPGIIEGDWANEGSSRTITAWKNAGELLTAEQKRSMGINPRVKLCWPLVETLTAKGLQDVNESLNAIFNAPILARNRDRPGVTVAKLAAGDVRQNAHYLNSKPQRLVAVKDSRTCAAALAENGTVYPPGVRPMLPLPGCDALSCRCTFVTHFPKRDPAEVAAQGALVDALLDQHEAKAKAAFSQSGFLAWLKRLFV